MTSPSNFDTISIQLNKDSMKRITVNEEKVAKQLAKLIGAVDLNLDDVGWYLAQMTPKIHYKRLQIVAEAAEAEQENINDRSNHYPLF